MKIKRLLLSAALVALCATAACAQRIFKDLPAGPGITKTYLGSALIGTAAADIPTEYIKMDKLTGMEVLSIEPEGRHNNADAIARARAIIDAFVKTHNLSAAVENEDDEDINIIYLSPDDATGNVYGIILNLEPKEHELNAVVISGQRKAAE